MLVRDTPNFSSPRSTSVMGTTLKNTPPNFLCLQSTSVMVIVSNAQRRRNPAPRHDRKPRGSLSFCGQLQNRGNARKLVWGSAPLRTPRPNHARHLPEPLAHGPMQKVRRMKKPAKAPRRSHAFGTSEPKRNVDRHDYDAETQTLTVHFASGKSYRYSGVPKDLADGFSGSSSSPERGSGSYLRQHIIGKFPHELI